MAEGLPLIEDDGTLLLVRTATDNAALGKFASFLESQVDPGNEAIKFADLVTSEQGKQSFADPAMRAKFAQQSQKKLAGILEDIQKEVERTDSMAVDKCGSEVRMARKALLRFAQGAQGSLEAAKDKIDALLRILGVSVSSGTSAKASRAADVPLHEKYKEAFQRAAAPAAAAAAPPPAAAEQEDPDGLKPIIVKYQGKGENPPPTDNLYVKGLPGTVTEEDITAIFSQVGTVQSQKLKVADWGAICFVRLTNRAEAGAAIAKFNGKIPDQLRKSKRKNGSQKEDKPESDLRAKTNGNGSGSGSLLGGASGYVEPRASEESFRQLQRLAFVEVDLSRPLGIFFDAACMAQDVGPGTQAESLGIPPGAVIKAIEGRLLSKGTEELVKCIGKAKKKGAASLVLAYHVPPLVVTFESRPFGLMAELDEKLGLFLVNEAQGQAREKGVRRGLALTAINDAELSGLTLDDCFQCLGSAPLPVTLTFRRVLSASASTSTVEASSGFDLFSDNEGEEPAAKVTVAQQSQQDPPLAEVPGLFFAKLDLSQPLGIGFDDRAVATQVKPESQGSKLGITTGAAAKCAGGRPLLGGTQQLVRRVQAAKRAGKANLSVGFTAPKVVSIFTARPFNFAVEYDSEFGLCRVRDAAEIATQKGIRPGLLLASVNNRQLFKLGEEEAVKHLKQAQLPVRLTFFAMPESAKAPVHEDFETTLPLSDVEAAPASESIAGSSASASSTAAAVPKRKRASADSRSLARSLDGLHFVRVDLAQPLGLFLDDVCVVQNFTGQAESWNLVPGAEVKSLAGRPLEPSTKALVKRVAKAKRKKLPSIVMGFSIPATTVTLKTRPFRFSAALDEGSGRFVVEDSGGMALAKGIKQGMLLQGVNGEEFLSMTEAELEEKLQQAALPAKFSLRSMPTEETGSILDCDDGPVVSSDEEMPPAPITTTTTTTTTTATTTTTTTASTAPAAATAAPENGGVKRAAPSPEAKKEVAPLDVSKLIFVQVDLSQPLGIGFDDSCVAEKLAPGKQGANLGIPKGAFIRYLAGRPLPASTKRLAQRMQRAKDRGLKEITLGFELPTFAVMFDERPFGFSFEWDESLRRFVVSFSRGAAEDQNVVVGCLLTSIEGDGLDALSKQEVQAKLKQATLPVRIEFSAPRPPTITTMAMGTAQVLSDSEAEPEVTEPAAKRSRPPAAEAEVPVARSLPGAVLQWSRPSQVRVDLSKPMGIFFDKECRVEKVGPGSQADTLGVQPGSQVCAVGGRPLRPAPLTAKMVKRIQRAKKKGRTSITLSFESRSVSTVCSSRPFPFSAELDATRGLFLLKEVSEDFAASAGLAPGAAVACVGGLEPANLSEKDFARVLEGVELPCEFSFQLSPFGDQAALAEPEISESEGEQ